MKIKVLIGVLSVLLWNIPGTILADSTTGLSGHWKFQDGTGAQALDSSEGARHAVLSPQESGPQWLKGREGATVLLLDGRDDYAQVSEDIVKNSTAFTVSFWMYPVRYATSNSDFLLSVNSCYHFVLDRSYIQFFYPGSSISIPGYSGQNRWTMISLVADGATFNLYLNGKQLASAPQVACASTRNSVVIGHTPEVDYKGRGLLGAMSDLRFYSRALTPEDLSEVYSSTSHILLDPLPPIRVSTTPQSALSVGTTSASLSLSTDKVCACKYSTLKGVAIDSMPGSFSSNATLTHATIVSGLLPGKNSYFVKCRDSGGNENKEDYPISISVNFPGAAEYFVSPLGTSTNRGTIESPWDLRSAAANESRLVRPGDTLWLREGTYSGRIVFDVLGTAAAPITIRNYRRERAIFDGKGVPASFSWGGGSDFVRLWGLEMIDSRRASVTQNPYSVFSDASILHASYINNIFHDGGMGVGHGSEAYGNVLYYNGHTSKEHGIYWQNDSTVTGFSKHIEDNVILNSSGYGIHSYSSSGPLTGLHYEGNTVFGSRSNANIIIGGGKPIDLTTIARNYTYSNTVAGLQLGYSNLHNTAVTVSANYFAGGNAGAYFKSPFDSIVMQNNTFVGILQWALSIERGPSVVFSGGPYTIDQNAYFNSTKSLSHFFYSNTATGDKAASLSQWRTDTGFDLHSSASSVAPADIIFIRPNRFEKGRANITVYNWSHADVVNVDLSASANSDGTPLLSVGDMYELHNAQDYFGDVIRGTYSGALIPIVMAARSSAIPAGRTVAAPLNEDANVISTFPEFGAFVLITILPASEVIPRSPANLRAVSQDG